MTQIHHRGRLIDHVHLRVADLGAAKRFYRAALAALGREPSFESDEAIAFDELASMIAARISASGGRNALSDRDVDELAGRLIDCIAHGFIEPHAPCGGPFELPGLNARAVVFDHDTQP